MSTRPTLRQLIKSTPASTETMAARDQVTTMLHWQDAHPTDMIAALDHWLDCRIADVIEMVEQNRR